MGGLVFLKLKRGMWFAACFVLILLFCSIPMKHYYDNYIVALAALVLSLIIIPIYAYLKRRKNTFYMRAYRSVKYDDFDTPVDKFKASPLLIHFKAEAIVAAFYSVLLSASFCYYLAKGKDLAETLLFCVLGAALCFAAMILLDFCVWIKAYAYWDRPKDKKTKN